MRLARYLPLFFLLAGVVLIPWTIWLTFSLPAHHESENWQTVWAGFDLAEAAALIATAVTALRRSPWLAPVAAVTGTLLCVDAWFDITLEVWLQSEQMRTRGLSPVLLSKSNAFKDMYWTFAQMLTHHASNGCNMQPGDLIASGTVSGLGPAERGCLLELTAGQGPWLIEGDVVELEITGLGTLRNQIR